ncbi:MAG: aminomethyl-transferring glycine dehydrogenase [Actinomycetota bacterium]|nr:aminomethyl-transferring glycine dehydrogenase [Actinomycetota bacterium]MDA3011096.1 aminomethyl-transferring glycine dehydrogenase [Actinomycetota bacterium]MDA3023979.1 aminomethyl-transferring glycine dehydrogenase [Actinomycetota bacterium]
MRSSESVSFDDLRDPTAFRRRHIGPSMSESDESWRDMLTVIGVESVDALIAAAVPAAIRSDEPLRLPLARSEYELTADLAELAARNAPRRSFIGLGYTPTITPPVIKRNVLENPAWYTAYTPYQPEISQGRLETLVNFQTVISDLTGLPVANASLLDEATAAAEAMTMARRISKNTGNSFFVDADTHPQIVRVLRTRAVPLGIDLVVGSIESVNVAATFGVLLSYPSSTGRIVRPDELVRSWHEAGLVVTVAADPMALVLLESPGGFGADIVIGSAQRFGLPMGFGGPHAAFIATSNEHARTLPGRLVGVSTDRAGRPALRLALQTREQHIRREKATSNICTAQALLANIAGLYAAWHGPDGLRRIAQRLHRLASIAASVLEEQGWSIRHDTWFDTICTEPTSSVDEVCAAARAAGFDIRPVDGTSVSLTVDECTTLDELAGLLSALTGVALTADDLQAHDGRRSGVAEHLLRSDRILTAPVFSSHRSEHEMLRYLRRLADKDLALDRTMIPLGSCTMKLNATSEMEPITWPSFADIHPFAPDDETIGYRQLIDDLENALAEITGYDAVSLQPNAGSQGEFAGLLAIKAYHESRGESDRNVCLIPSSAHGTNAASAVMAGMRVVVVACDEDGNVDLADLDRRIGEHRERLAAVMVTYPSTHGVFEEGIVRLCDMVHEAGGQVYVDGANLNALVGLARPGWFGADVSHLNLHKTFCIPHGGGGPGVGPVAVRAHLAPFLPGDPRRDDDPVGPVSAAPYGSAGILPISWMYMGLMGPDGLRRATEAAIVNANYMARRLSAHFPVLYTGAAGFVAHECIIDLRPITKATGVTVDDVAKRLMDYGFHAPTVSFPVAGTMMIEPTESEAKGELDRFCDAMAAIRVEIDEIEAGRMPIDDSPLRLAPHTIDDLVGPWDRVYPRDVASPAGARWYHAPVGRIDAAHGDRNLVCTCEPLSSYA